MTYANYLELFNYVINHGDKKGPKTYFNNLTAWHEIDGYTCYLSDNKVTVTLLFHSRFSYEHEDKSSLVAFQKETLKIFSAIQQQRVNKKQDNANE